MSVLLNVEGLKAWYGNTQVLFDVSLTVEEGQVISLMGRNGMGKSTTISSILGMMNHIAVSYTHLTLPTIYSV